MMGKLSDDCLPRMSMISLVIPCVFSRVIVSGDFLLHALRPVAASLLSYKGERSKYPLFATLLWIW